jgi:hypothetical protein
MKSVKNKQLFVELIIAIILIIVIGIVIYFGRKTFSDDVSDNPPSEIGTFDMSSATFSDSLGSNQTFTLTPANINDFLQSPTQLVEFPIELFYATNANLTFMCNIVSIDPINSTINFKFFGNYQSNFFNVYYTYSFSNPSQDITISVNPLLTFTLTNFNIYAPVFQAMTTYIAPLCVNKSDGDSCVPQQSVCIAGECVNCLIDSNWNKPECIDMLKNLCIGELRFCDNPTIVCGQVASSNPECAEDISQCQYETQSYFQQFGISCNI